MAAESLKKVKIIVIGDSGVGKSALVHLICHKEVLSHPAWTVGCSVEVKLHDHGISASSTSTYFVELWDVGGSPSHKKGRVAFYQQVHGIILVHDLTNRKSHSHLVKWLAEFHQAQGRDGGNRNGRSVLSDSRSDLEYDPERFADQEVPILIVGTKVDQMSSGKVSNSSGVAGAASINVDCTNVRQFAVDSQQMIELNKFFDKVIERRFFPSLHMTSSSTQSGAGGGERHRTTSKRLSSHSFHNTELQHQLSQVARCLQEEQNLCHEVQEECITLQQRILQQTDAAAKVEVQYHQDIEAVQHRLNAAPVEMQPLHEEKTSPPGRVH